MKHLSLLLVLVAALHGFTVTASDTVDVTIPEKELAAVTAEASQGDRSAMWRLFQHYQFSSDIWSYVYWGERLARLNDKHVLLNLADLYDRLGTPRLCKRAVALAKQRAALSDNPLERDAALKIARHYAGQDIPLYNCGRKRPNKSFKPTPLRGAA